MILDGDMEARRGPEHHLFRAGDLCVWTPSARHSGRPHRSGRWEARLIMFELSALEGLVLDPDVAGAVRFTRGPRVRDGQLAASFLRLHRSLERPSPALEREGRLTALMTDLLGQPLGSPIKATRARRDPALRRASELLSDDPSANITLERLAALAGTDRHRLTRLFLAAHGLPPHRFQLARRLSVARGLLERGRSVVEAASRAGFFDQSHLHRHFRRAFGLTPARYLALLRSSARETKAGSTS